MPRTPTSSRWNRTSRTPHGHIITAAIAILEDGTSRSADDILSEALKAKLVPPRRTRKYVYSALIEYIARTIGHGRKPQIVQDAERRFRINEPQDDWSPVTAWTAPALDADAKALIEADYATLIGPDFSDEIELIAELNAHKVTAFTVAGRSSPSTPTASKSAASCSPGSRRDDRGTRAETRLGRAMRGC